MFNDNKSNLTDAELFARFLKLPLFPGKVTAEDLMLSGGGEDIGLADAQQEWLKQVLTSDDPTTELETLRDHLSGVLAHVEHVLNGYRHYVEVECDDALTPRERVLLKIDFFKRCSASGEDILQMIEANVLDYSVNSSKIIFFDPSSEGKNEE